MPNRILREGIIGSDVINRLDWPAEVFYRRLMSIVDDYGRIEARLAMIRAALYQLRLDRVREADVERWMAECQKAGAIRLYESGGKPYLVVLKVDRPRASKSKCPQPPKGVFCWRGEGRDTVLSPDLRAEESVCAQAQTSVPYSDSLSSSDSFSDSLNARAHSGGRGGKNGKSRLTPHQIREVATAIKGAKS